MHTSVFNVDRGEITISLPALTAPGFPNPLSCSEAKTLSTKPATPNFTKANDEEDEKEEDGCGGVPYTHPSDRLLPW